MNDATYNGWANYETWRIALEVFEGFNADEWLDDSDLRPDSDNDEDGWAEVVNTLADWLESIAEEVVLSGLPEGLGRDLAAAFLNKVNYYEIASHYIADLR